MQNNKHYLDHCLGPRVIRHKSRVLKYLLRDLFLFDFTGTNERLGLCYLSASLINDGIEKDLKIQITAMRN